MKSTQQLIDEKSPIAYSGQHGVTDLALHTEDAFVCPASPDTLYPSHEWRGIETQTDEGHRMVWCVRCHQYATEPDERQYIVVRCHCGQAWHVLHHDCCVGCEAVREDDRQHDMDEQRLREGE